MKKIGTLLLMDSVTSMNRDRVNFEDKVISAFRTHNRDKLVYSRSVKGKTAPNCLELLRKRASEYSFFSNKMDDNRAYILLGLAEENHSISKRWFETTMHHIIDEVIFLGFDPCIVSCRKKSEYSERSYQKVHDGKKQLYVNTPNWNYTSCYSLNIISKQRNVDMIKCDVRCANQWDTLSIETINRLTNLISRDLDSFVNDL